IDIATDVGMKQQRIELGSEDELPVYLCIKQRLLPHAIAREKQFLPTRIPDREGKHPAQVFWTVSAKLVVGMNDGFGVAVGVERVAKVFQLLAQLEIVVDLAVEDDPRGSIPIVNGLLAALEIDDREAAHGQTHRAVDIET